jgi:hypothetical protein
MADLDVALADLETILTSVQTDRKLDTPAARVKLVIETRSKVIKKIAEIMHFTAADAKMKGDPAMAKQFGERLQSLRHTLAGLQAKWRAVNLEEDFQGYARESRVSAQACLDFVRWARSIR